MVSVLARNYFVTEEEEEEEESRILGVDEFSKDLVKLFKEWHPTPLHCSESIAVKLTPRLIAHPAVKKYAIVRVSLEIHSLKAKTALYFGFLLPIENNQ